MTENVILCVGACAATAFILFLCYGFYRDPYLWFHLLRVVLRKETHAEQQELWTKVFEKRRTKTGQ